MQEVENALASLKICFQGEKIPDAGQNRSLSLQLL